MADPSAAPRDVLVAARAGDRDAGRTLMTEFGPSMVRTARSVLGRYGGNEADDVIQEAFIAALTTPALPTGDVGAWLRAITARKALDAVRGAKRRETRQLSDSAVDDPETRPDVLAVREGLSRLSPADRAVLVLVDIEGHPMAHAAAALGVTRIAVRLRAVRARRKLAALLKEGRR